MVVVEVRSPPRLFFLISKPPCHHLLQFLSSTRGWVEMGADGRRHQEMGLTVGRWVWPWPAMRIGASIVETKEKTRQFRFIRIK
jgi:hypothetical protein